MCGYGSVTVTTVGGAAFPLWFIGSPQIFHSTLQKAVLDAKNAIRSRPEPPESGSPRRTMTGATGQKGNCLTVTRRGAAGGVHAGAGGGHKP